MSEVGRIVASGNYYATSPVLTQCSKTLVLKSSGSHKKSIALFAEFDYFTSLKFERQLIGVPSVPVWQ